MSSRIDIQLLQDYQNDNRYQFTLDHTRSINEQKQPCKTYKSFSDSNTLEMINQKEIQIEENNLEDKEDLEKDFFENNLNINEYTAHKIPLDELKRHLKTDLDNGLTNKQAYNRLKQQGRNIITENTSKQYTIIKFVKELLNNYHLHYMGCIGLFIVYGLNPKDAYNLYLAILVLSSTLINGFLIFFQKQKKHYLIQKMPKQLKKVNVIREGLIIKIEEEELVEGDIIFVCEDQIFPADIRVIQYEDLIVNEYSITQNIYSKIYKSDKYLEDESYEGSQNVLFQDCYCESGKAKGIVIKTGNRTFKGSSIYRNQRLKSDQQKINLIFSFSIFFQIFAIIVGVIIFLISYISKDLTVYQSISISISIILSISPTRFQLNLYTSNNKMIQNLKEKQNIIVSRSPDDFEELGGKICIFLDIDTLTQNVWEVKNIWYGGRDQSNYDINNKDFQALLSCLIITNTANFVHSFEEKNNNNINYSTCEAEGSAVDIGQLRFLQSILNVEDFKKRVQYTYQQDGRKACHNLPFYNQKYFHSFVIEEETQNSHYTIVMKGEFQFLIDYCSYIQIENKAVDLDDNMFQDIWRDYEGYLKNCNIVIGVAKVYLSKEQFPRGYQTDLDNYFIFNCKNAIFCGMISQEDLMIDNILQVYHNLNATNVKVILVASNIDLKTLHVIQKTRILDGIVTNIQLENQGMSIQESINQCKGFIAQFYQLKEIEMKLIFKKKICLLDQYILSYFLKSKFFEKQGYQTVYVSSQLKNNKQLFDFDKLVFYGNAYDHKIKNRAHIFLNDNKLDQLIPLIDEGRKQKNNLQQALGLYCSSIFIKILSFFAFVILDIPLPTSSVYIYLIFFILDYFISVLYESPEIALNINQPQFSERWYMSLIRFFFYFILVGFLYISTGLIGYFTTLNYYGFPVKSLLGINSLLAYKPPIGDYNNHINPQSNQQESYFNQNLYKQSFDCTTSQIDEYKFKINWLNDENQYFDLRKAFLKCNDNNKLWEPSLNWSYCDVDSVQNISPITNESICYSTEALKYAQTSFFISIMFLYWIKITFCQNRHSFFFTQEINKKTIQTILIQFLIVISFLYIPGVQEAFGTRPIQFWLFGIPSFTIIIWYFFLVELRIYLKRNYRWFYKYF